MFLMYDSWIRLAMSGALWEFGRDKIIGVLFYVHVRRTVLNIHTTIEYIKDYDNMTGRTYNTNAMCCK